MNETETIIQIQKAGNEMRQRVVFEFVDNSSSEEDAKKLWKFICNLPHQTVLFLFLEMGKSEGTMGNIKDLVNGRLLPL